MLQTRTTEETYCILMAKMTAILYCTTDERTLCMCFAELNTIRYINEFMCIGGSLSYHAKLEYTSTVKIVMLARSDMLVQ